MPEPAAAPDLDPLTGLPGRMRLLADLDAAITAASDAERAHLWLAIASIPRLAYVNAGFGPETGDDLLRGVAETIRREIPEAFVIARLEGAELATASFGPDRRMSLRGDDSPVRFIGAVIESRGTRLFTSLRVGFTHWAPGDDAASMLHKARLALAHARADSGHDRMDYSESMERTARDHVRVARELHDAIDHDRLVLQYQPKIDLASGAMVGVEALVRWPTEDGGSIPPGMFIDAAEASGLVVPLGDWVLRTGCRQAARWQAQGLAPFHVAMNVSPLQFHKTELLPRLRDLMQETGVGPEWIELEITEGAAMYDPDEMVRRLTAIRDLGIELALDDFGTGYSSLSYLKRFPLDRLKIDQSFVRHCDEQEEDRAIVRTAIVMGKTLGLRVLAEGVETERHVDFLASEHCDEVQGYYFSRPLAPDALAEFARENDRRIEERARS